MYAKHFSLSNLPYGIATSERHPRPSIVTRVGDNVYFLSAILEFGILNGVPASTVDALLEPTLNALAALPQEERREFRSILQHLFGGQSMEIPQDCVVSIDNVKMLLPIKVGEFTDFSCSKDHLYNAGEAITGQRLLPPGFLSFPTAYAGRASSIVVSATPITRPMGQFRGSEGKVVYAPTKALDYELEMACIIGKASQQGEPVPASDAFDYIFGLVLLNDWSARDIQGLEMMPLGPFNSKSFGTSISPWVVTTEALEPFRVPLPSRDLPAAQYLVAEESKGSYDIQLQAEFLAYGSATTVCRSKFDSMYWSFQHLVAHQTVGGCRLNNGDVLATGTISGSTAESHGCLLELTKGGKENFSIGGDEKRTYLLDGDSVRLSAFAGKESDGVGFGECIGMVVSAGAKVN